MNNRLNPLLYAQLYLEGQHHDRNALLKQCEAYPEDPFWIFIQQWLDGSDTIAVQTSGSTGPPKTILLQKGQMVSSALNTGHFLRLGEGDKALLCLSCHYIAGKMMVVRAFVLGLDLYRASAQSPWTGLADRHIKFAAMVPAQVSKTLAEAPGALSHLDYLIIGGAPVPPALLEALQALDTRCYATYGMTETTSHIALRRLNQPGPSTVYRTLPGVRVEIDDRDCLVIHAPCVADAPVVTNDVVEWLSPSAFRWLGRRDHAINSGGIKLHPEQIEDKIKEWLPCRYFIIGEANEKWGQQVTLVLEQPALSQKEQEALLKKLSTVLGKYEMPKAIRFRKRFEETGSGKVKRML